MKECAVRGGTRDVNKNFRGMFFLCMGQADSIAVLLTDSFWGQQFSTSSGPGVGT